MKLLIPEFTDKQRLVALEKYLVRYRHRLKERAILIDMMTIVSEGRVKLNIQPPDDNQLKTFRVGGITSFELHPEVPHLQPGDIVDIYLNNEARYGLGYVDSVVTSDGNITANLGLLSIGLKVTSETDKITLRSGMTANYTGPEVVTTVGRFITNEIILVEPFGATLPYINSEWSPKKVDTKLAELLLNQQITKTQYDQYVDNIFYLGHFTELCVPTFSMKSLTTDPRVEQVKQELLEKYKGRLNTPEAIKDIENTLFKLDKDWLKDDSSYRFFNQLKDSFNVHRKKLYLTIGGIPAFDASGAKLDFIENSLQEGWNAHNFSALANESRKGSYDRGKNTAKGGALTKFIMRVFQDSRIVEEDCKSTKGITVTLTDDTVKKYLGRKIVGGDVITEQNSKGLIGKTVSLRSALYCKTQNGFCYTCIGDVFRKLDSEALGLLAIEISSVFMYQSMKSMHVGNVEFVEIGDPNNYVHI